jgi:hypothetical protein
VLIPTCPLCGGPERYYSFLLDGRRFDQCQDCGLLMRTTTLAGTAVRAQENGRPVTGPGEPVESGVGSAFFTLHARYVPFGDLQLGIVGKGLQDLADRSLETVKMLCDYAHAAGFLL